jgi:RNA polymerase sigma-70 factor (ECF subfamily)
MTSSRKERFRRLYADELRYIWSSLQRLGVPPRDLEDVAHETLLSVYRRLADYDETRPLRPWLFGFLYRTAADYRKRMHRRHEVGVDEGELDEIPDHAPSAEQELAQDQARALVANALRSMPIERSAVFVMMDIDGQSAPEVVDALGIPLNTVYSRIRVAREEFASTVRRLQTRKVARD